MGSWCRVKHGWVPLVKNEQVVVEKIDGCTCWGACELGVPWACAGPILWCLEALGSRWELVGQIGHGTDGKLAPLGMVQWVVV